MRRTGRALLLTLVLGALPLPVVVNAQEPSALFDSASRAFQQQDYSAALAAFQAARDAGMDGPAIHYNIAVCYYKMGDYTQAESTFRAIADRFPTMRALAEYNLGLSLVQLDRLGEARAAFQRARAGTDETVVRLADAMLARIAPDDDASPPPSAWLKLVDFNLGYDDNVALIEESSLPAVQSTESPLTEVFALLSGPLTDGSRIRFDASSYLVSYADADRFNQVAVHLAASYRWNSLRWRLEVGPQVDYSTLDGDGFERYLGVAVDLRRSLNARTVFAVRFAHDEVDDLNSRFSYVEGSRDRIRLRLEQRWDQSRLVLDYQFESNARASASVSPDRSRVAVRYRQRMTPQWIGELQYAYRVSRYDELTTPRDEDLSQLGLSATRALPRGWQLNAQYWFSDNDSDEVLYSYKRNRVSFGFGRSF